MGRPIQSLPTDIKMLKKQASKPLIPLLTPQLLTTDQYSIILSIEVQMLQQNPLMQK